MISPMMVYLVMQADSLVLVCMLLGLVGLCVGGGMYFFSVGEYDCAEIAKQGKRIGLAGIAFCILAAAIPSTKTAAAMIVLPAITSDRAVESVAPEVRELYDLTKDALRSLGGRRSPRATTDVGSGRE